MDNNVLEITEYTGEGYKPLIDFATWRVAILRWIESMLPERSTYLERHNQTDEVFVLLNGQATLFLGGNSLRVDGIDTQLMECGKLYNVKRNAWHGVVMSRDATILLVENRDTGDDNSEYWQLNEAQRLFIRSCAEADI